MFEPYIVSPFVRMMLGECFGLSPFAVDMVIEARVRGSYNFSGQSGSGGKGSRRNVPGTFVQPKSMNKSSKNY